MLLTGGIEQDGTPSIILKGMGGSSRTPYLFTGFIHHFLDLDYDLSKVPRPNVSRTSLFCLDPTPPCAMY
jgi:hypothetical protein